MWAASSTAPSPICRRLPIPTRPPPSPPVSAIYAKSQSPKTDNNSTLQSLGHTIHSAFNSPNPNSPNPNRQSKTPKQEEAAQIRGSDVLWALQKAAAVKEKNKSRQVKDKQKEGPSTEGSDFEKSEVNPKVRQLRINTDWGFRLSDLEKRLQEIISETV